MKNKQRQGELMALAYLTLRAMATPPIGITYLSDDAQHRRYVRYWGARMKLLQRMPREWNAWLRMTVLNEA